MFLRTREHNGKVLVTSENARWMLITKEEQEEIVHDKISPNLHKKLEENKLIMTENNSQAILADMKEKNGMLLQNPTLHIIVPTTRCNLNCIYCHSMPCEKQDMDKETAGKTIDFILNSPAKTMTIEFQGGEPLLNFEIVRYIIEEAKQKKDIKFDLVTNLTQMTEEIASYLMENDISICTSLDGPKDIHDKNRPGSYDLTIKWIDYFRKKGYPINAGLVITRNSLGRGKDIVDEYMRQGLRWIKLRPADPTGKALSDNQAVPTADEYITFWKETIDYLLDMNKRTFLPDRHTYFLLTKLYQIQAYYSELASPCGAIIGQLAYNPDGTISCCDEARIHELFTIGNVDQPFKEVVTSEKSCSIISASLNDTLLCDACAFKPFCGVCPVCTYAKTGSLVPILSQDDRCRILQAQFTHLIDLLQTDKKDVLEDWLRRTKHF
ncbi:MAG: radical SAM protein [Candidatus Woesearchaeota archaeon]